MLLSKVDKLDVDSLFNYYDFANVAGAACEKGLAIPSYGCMASAHASQARSARYKLSTVSVALPIRCRRQPCINEEAKAKAKEFVNNKLDDIAGDINALRSRIIDEDYRLLPMSYIAKNYFGKSSAWLSQRINGTLVRGKTYTLTMSRSVFLMMP